MLKWKWWNKSSHSSESLLAVTQHGSDYSLARVKCGDSQRPDLLECALQGQLSDPATTIQQLVTQHNVKNIHAITVMPHGTFDIFLMEALQVPMQEMNDAIRWQIKDRISYSPEDAIVQTIEIPGQVERGRVPMVYVIAAERSQVQQQIDLLEGNNIDLQYIDIPELAQRNVAMFCPEDAIGVAMLRLEATRGVLTITQGGDLYLARELDNGYMGLVEQNNLVQTDASGLQLVDTVSDTEYAFDQIILEIQRSLDYYESHFSKIPIGSLVIAPLPIEIPDIEEKLSGLLGVLVRELDMNEIVQSQVPLDRERQAECFTAIGAALRWSTNMAMISNMT